MVCTCHSLLLVMILITTLAAPAPALAQPSVNFYATSCPSIFDFVRSSMRDAINRETRIGASLIRLHFYDCFVNVSHYMFFFPNFASHYLSGIWVFQGCDGSVLLVYNGSFVGERSVPANGQTIRVFEVIDRIKREVTAACGANVVSCADILALSARDSVVELGGQSYTVPLGRRDKRTASAAAVRSDLPAFFEDLQSLIGNFSGKGFTPREMVVLSGAHIVGQAGCVTFRDRICNDTNIDPAFATERQANFPQNPSPPGDRILAPLDPQNPNRFGNNYFQALLNRRGLLNSDQVMFNGGSTDSIVREYSNDMGSFAGDFSAAMIKMENLSPLTGTQGEIRNSCQTLLTL